MDTSNKELFMDFAYSNIHRYGITKFLNWLENETDFFFSPASTKYHGAYEGGLVEHSLYVYYMFIKLAPAFNYDLSNPTLAESATITTLFHDVCKINSYEKSFRNVKNKDGAWEQVPCYIYSNNASKFGAHGAYSVFLINQFMSLSEAETIAIYHHMGLWDSGKYDDTGKAYENCKLAWLVHVSDEAATYIAGV